jgi:hypothetical protein
MIDDFPAIGGKSINLGTFCAVGHGDQKTQHKKNTPTDALGEQKILEWWFFFLERDHIEEVSPT